MSVCVRVFIFILHVSLTMNGVKAKLLIMPWPVTQGLDLHSMKFLLSLAWLGTDLPSGNGKEETMTIHYMVLKPLLA